MPVCRVCRVCRLISVLFPCLLSPPSVKERVRDSLGKAGRPGTLDQRKRPGPWEGSADYGIGSRQETGELPGRAARRRVLPLACNGACGLLYGL